MKNTTLNEVKKELQKLNDFYYPTIKEIRNEKEKVFNQVQAFKKWEEEQQENGFLPAWFGCNIINKDLFKKNVEEQSEKVEEAEKQDKKNDIEKALLNRVIKYYNEQLKAIAYTIAKELFNLIKKYCFNTRDLNEFLKPIKEYNNNKYNYIFAVFIDNYNSKLNININSNDYSHNYSHNDAKAELYIHHIQSHDNNYNYYIDYELLRTCENQDITLEELVVNRTVYKVKEVKRNILQLDKIKKEKADKIKEIENKEKELINNKALNNFIKNI